ncbi:MAG: excinuclease ABC subunit A, partial [Planctomycetes bacterium]|nr:excinuclease ABC subunit A [Planctomycetota bacterium]
IKCADWLIDLGPEGGDAGGRIVAEGPPAEVANIEDSHTGHFLKRYFTANRSPERQRRGSKQSKGGGRSTRKSSAKKKAATKSKSAKKKPRSSTKPTRKKAVAK